MPSSLDSSQAIPARPKRTPEALAAVMREHNRRLFRTARAILGDDSEAEDVVQATYLRAFGALDQFAGNASITTWLTRIVVNEALGRLRRSRRISSFEDLTEDETAEQMTRNEVTSVFAFGRDGDPADEAARDEMRALIEKAIDALPAGFRTVFMLRAVEEMSVEETAECLGIPEATVKSRLHRAKERLRADLEQRVDLSLPEAFSFDGARCDRLVNRVLQQIGAAESDFSSSAR